MVIESLKLTNREQTGAKRGGQQIKVSIDFCCVFLTCLRYMMCVFNWAASHSEILDPIGFDFIEK